jgi:cytochrome oxidase Cu insertion factor (SCO1/SenC/PrrC family)
MSSIRQSSLPAILLALMTLTLTGPVYTHGQTIATDFTLKDIDGKQFSLSDFKGKKGPARFLRNMV